MWNPGNPLTRIPRLSTLKPSNPQNSKTTYTTPKKNIKTQEWFKDWSPRTLILWKFGFGDFGMWTLPTEKKTCPNKNYNPEAYTVEKSNPATLDAFKPWCPRTLKPWNFQSLEPWNPWSLPTPKLPIQPPKKTNPGKIQTQEPSNP